MIKKYYEHIKRKINTFKFKKRLKIEKSKLYMNDSVESYKSKRNKFSIFKSKLEFYNTFEDIKKINTYYYIVWTFLILSSLYVLFFSHYFSIKNIDIIRQDDLINIDLAYRTIDYSRYRPILTEDKEKMKHLLLNHQPNIKDIYIRKILPDNVKIIINSYKWIFWFEKDWKNYIVTENGVTVPSKVNKGITKINVIFKENISIFDYKKIFYEIYLSRINQIISLIKDKSLFIKIQDITYYKKESELHITSKDWTIILFDLTKEPIVQIEKLNIFYKKYLTKLNTWIVYIDLRVNEKIFYCSIENEDQCKKNLKNIYN